MSSIVVDNRRASSLRHFSPKRMSKMKLFKTNSVGGCGEGVVLDGVVGCGRMEGGVVGRATAATAAAAASVAPSATGGPRHQLSHGLAYGGPPGPALPPPGAGGGGATSRGSSSSGSSGHGVGVGPTMTVGGLTSSTQTLAVTSTPRSLSLASISSEGSADSHVVEQEDIVALTTAVRAFKEALGRLKRIFHPERDKTETLRVAAHERLGEVLRILRSILEKYGPIQHNELLASASHLISHVNGFSYEDEKADPTSFLEAIDQLALAFSSRVSEYLMGDIDTSSAFLNCSTASSRTKSCENLVSSDAESTGGGDRAGSGGGSSGGGGGSGSSSAPLDAASVAFKEPEILTQQQIDDYLYRHEQGVEYALHRAKVWSKYAKDVVSYIEKRAQFEMEYARGITKLAHTIRPQLKEESFLPFQSIYCTALDQDIENCSNLTATCTLLQTHKFIEPLMARRNEHERSRKSIKDMWHRELKRVTEAVANLKKAKCAYIQRHQELLKARESAARAENTEAQDKLERKREEAMTKAREAEVTYRSCVSEANERHASLQKVKREVLLQTRELILQCDQTMKAVTVGYFQLQHTVAAPAPIQYQTLCESSRLYEPGSQYMEFVKRLGPTLTPEPLESPFSFESYTPGAPHHEYSIGPESHANGSMASTDDLQVVGRLQGGSDTDSVGSSRSGKSMDGSPSASPIAPQRRLHTGLSSGDELELETDADNDVAWVNRRQVMSKAADTHAFRKLKTPSRCRECDSYVYFHGYECGECGLACHKKCLETLAIQCGHKRLPRKMTTFGVDLGQHLSETSTPVPHLVLKCVSEIDARGTKIKGIYRVSGVKSRVEKLCQAFENGAHLVDLTDQHPNVIANVLKLYLRQLPEPLLTFRLYPEFIRIAKECPSNGGPESNKAADELRELVRRLPRHHLQCLAVLMHHLHRVGNNAGLNNMPSSNLGIVFGPTLLRTAEGSASLSSLVDTVHQTRAIELLITYANEVFGSSENYLPLTSLVSMGSSSSSSSSSVTSATSTSHLTASAVMSSAAIRGHRTDDHAKMHPQRSPVEIQIVPATPQPNEGQGSVPGSSVPIPVIQRRTGGREIEISLDDSSTASTPPTQPHTPLHHHPSLKERKGSELDEDWEWDGEESSSELGDLSSPRVLSHGRSTPGSGSAHIVKTSLKNYVGLEGVEVRTSTGVTKTESSGAFSMNKAIASVGVAGVGASGLSVGGVSVTGPGIRTEEHRKISPLLAHRSGLTSGTDSSIDSSDYSFEYDVRQQNVQESPRSSSYVAHMSSPLSSLSSIVPTPTTSTPLLSSRSSISRRPEVSVSGGLSRELSVSRDPSLDNITSSDSSSQELDSAHATEDSHSSEAADDTEAVPSHTRTLAYTSGYSGSGSSGGESGYVSPYLTNERNTGVGGSTSGIGGASGSTVTLGPSLLLTRATIAQYDHKRTITTVVAPKSTFDENRVRIQVPAAAGVPSGSSVAAPRVTGSVVTSGSSVSIPEASVTVTKAGAQQQSQIGEMEESSQEPESVVIPLSKQSLQNMRESDMQPPPSPLSPDLREERKPSPNRAPRFV